MIGFVLIVLENEMGVSERLKILHHLFYFEVVGQLVISLANSYFMMMDFRFVPFRVSFFA